VIFDTNAVSALFAGDADLELLLQDETVHQLPVIVIGEYRYGLARSKHGRQLEHLLDLLIEESEVLVIDEGTTRHYANVRQQLRRAGTPIPENDVWIAAECGSLPPLLRSRSAEQTQSAADQRIEIIVRGPE